MHIPSTLNASMRFNFLYVDKYIFSKNWYYPASVVPYNLLRLCLRGTATFWVDGEALAIEPGEVTYISEGSVLECSSAAEEFSFISIRFTTTMQLPGNDFLSEFFHLPRQTKQAPVHIQRQFHAVYQSAMSQKADKLFRIRGNLELIVADLVDIGFPQNSTADVEDKPPGEVHSLERIRHRENKTAAMKQDARIQVVVNYLIANPKESFNSSFLSEMAEMSPSSLRRRFKEHTGKSPNDFIKDLRMMTAARRLLVTDERVSHIAYDVGYNDPNYFARTFRATFGVSPQQYRRSARE